MDTEDSVSPGARRWSHWAAVLIAVLSLAALAWWRTPTQDELRATPARQREQQTTPRQDDPAAVELQSPDDRAASGGGLTGLELYPVGAEPESDDPTLPVVPLDASAPRSGGERATSGVPTNPGREERGTVGHPPIAAVAPPRPSSPPDSLPAPSLLAATRAEASVTVEPTAPVAAPRMAVAEQDSPSRNYPAPDPAGPASPAVPNADAAPAALRDAAAEEEAIGQVLGEYVEAYNRLDAGAARRVWPTVDERALRRAFSGLESQGISFEACDLGVDGADATATCRGRARYVPKVGERDPISQSRTWRFRLHHGNGGWQIVHAEAR